MHYDNLNFGVTFLIAFDVHGTLLCGSGSHVLCSSDFAVAVQVCDHRDGLVTLGDYRRVLHGNRGVTGAADERHERLIITAYCAQSVVDLCKLQ